MICVELSDAAYRVSLCGPGAELEGGGVQTPPPPGPARVAPSTGPARVNHALNLAMNDQEFTMKYRTCSAFLLYNVWKSGANWPLFWKTIYLKFND